MGYVGSCKKRTSCVPYLQLLLIVWAGPVTIDALPHDVLLHIFHFDRSIHLDGLNDFNRHHPWRWDRLVHVCHLWRSIIFASPNYLDLKLVCRPWSRAEFTGIWPPFPIVIMVGRYESHSADYAFDAVTTHRNRMREIHLHGIREIHKCKDWP